MAQQIQLGAVDFGPITTAPLSTLVPEMSVFQLPYIFRDYEHVFKALDGSDTITKYYDGVLDKKGLKLIGFIAAGYRGIYGHTAINSLADVKGKKVRVQEDKILVATFKALGMISTPIAFPEVATALQTQRDRFRRGRRQHLLPQQVLRHRQVRGRRAPHAPGRGARSCPRPPGRSRMRPARRRSWTPGRTRATFNRKFILDEDKSIQDQVRAKGVTITKPDATPFRQATLGVYEEFYATPAGKDARKMVDFILSIK